MFFCSTFRGWFTQTEFADFLLNHFFLCVFVVCLEFEQNSEAKGDTEDWQRGRCECRLLISVSELSAIVNFGTPGRNARGERIALLSTSATDLRISILAMRRACLWQDQRGWPSLWGMNCDLIIFRCWKEP